MVIVIMYFQIKVQKRFIGNILQIVILDFSADILTLSVKIWCLKTDYGQLAYRRPMKLTSPVSWTIGLI